jgi:superfamily II DNA or RNA helicase
MKRKCTTVIDVLNDMDEKGTKSRRVEHSLIPLIPEWLDVSYCYKWSELCKSVMFMRSKCQSVQTMVADIMQDNDIKTISETVAVFATVMTSPTFLKTLKAVLTKRQNNRSHTNLFKGEPNKNYRVSEKLFRQSTLIFNGVIYSNDTSNDLNPFTLVASFHNDFIRGQAKFVRERLLPKLQEGTPLAEAMFNTCMLSVSDVPDESKGNIIFKGTNLLMVVNDTACLGVWKNRVASYMGTNVHEFVSFDGANNVSGLNEAIKCSRHGTHMRFFGRHVVVDGNKLLVDRFDIVIPSQNKKLDFTNVGIWSANWNSPRRLTDDEVSNGDVDEVLESIYNHHNHVLGQQDCIVRASLLFDLMSWLKPLLGNTYLSDPREDRPCMWKPSYKLMNEDGVMTSYNVRSVDELPMSRCPITGQLVLTVPGFKRPTLLTTDVDITVTQQDALAQLAWMTSRSSVERGCHIIEDINDSNKLHCIGETFVNTTTRDKHALEIKKNGSVVVMDTGSGKTLVGIMAICAEIERRAEKEEEEAKGTSSSSSSSSGTKTRDVYLYLVQDQHALQTHSEFLKHTSLDPIMLSTTKDMRSVKTREKVVTNRTGPLVYVVTHTVIRSKAWLQDMNVSKIHMMIVDEIHALKRKSKTAQMIMHYMKPTIVVGLTATPKATTSQVLVSLTTFQPEPTPRHVDDFETMCMITGTTPTSRTKLKIDRQVILVKPDQFVVEAHRLLENFDPSEITGSQQRVYRIFERICAGGYVDGEAIMEVLKQLLTKRRHNNSNNMSASFSSSSSSSVVSLVVKDDANAQLSFALPRDECSICMCDFDTPRQLVCGHVMCEGCLTSLLNIARRQCPVCRAPFVIRGSRLTVFLPTWLREMNGKDEKLDANEVSSDCPTETKQKRDDDDNYRALLKGEGDGARTLISGKITAFKQYINGWLNTRKKSHRLVVFSKREVPCQLYLSHMQSKGLVVKLAGAGRTDRKTSLVNIEAFRQGQGDVLLCNFKYSTGFDLCNASHLLCTDSDLSTWLLTQALGRVTRLGQHHKKVEVRTLVFQGCFDEFVYKQAIKGRHLNNGMCRNRAINMVATVTVEIPGTQANDKFIDYVANQRHRLDNVMIKRPFEHQPFPHMSTVRMYTNHCYGSLPRFD